MLFVQRLHSSTLAERDVHGHVADRHRQFIDSPLVV